MTKTAMAGPARTIAVALMAGAAMLAAPAQARDDDDDDAVELATCSENLGSIAVVDGDTQGWAKVGLGSPRELVNALAVQSGCFTPHSPASGDAADFLMNVIAGDSEEVDQSIEMAKSAAMQGLVSSGAASSLLGSVPGAGQLLGMFGGLGGKKKRYAAGIKLLSPATGMTIATGTGEVKKTTISFGGSSAWNAGAQAAGYVGDKRGEMLVEAFVIAFNQLVAQQAAIAAVPRGGGADDDSELATVAAATAMLESPADSARVLRSLRAGTTLTPTGKREGLYIQAEDNFGTIGWVSIESLN